MESHNFDNQEIDYQEDLSIFWKAFSFLFPIVGVGIYFVQKSKGEALKAKSGLEAGVAGMILNVLLLLMQNYL